MKTTEKIMILLLIIIITTMTIITLKEKTKNPYEKECLEWVKEKYKFSKAVETGNEKLCPNEYCIAAIRKNTSYCNIGDEIEKKLCLAVVLQDETQCKGIEEICKTLTPSEEIKKQEKKCKLVGAITEAITKQDLSICEKVKEKEICKKWAQKKEFGASDIIKI